MDTQERETVTQVARLGVLEDNFLYAFWAEALTVFIVVYSFKHECTASEDRDSVPLYSKKERFKAPLELPQIPNNSVAEWRGKEKCGVKEFEWTLLQRYSWAKNEVHEFKDGFGLERQSTYRKCLIKGFKKMSEGCMYCCHSGRFLES